MSDFPTTGVKQDSQHFLETPEDPAARSSMEGGYVVTRPRHTRTPRKTFKTGFTCLTQAQKVAMAAFYNTKRGGSHSFTWTDPTAGTEYTVRFKSALAWKYVGILGVHLWDATVELEQV